MQHRGEEPLQFETKPSPAESPRVVEPPVKHSFRKGKEPLQFEIKLSLEGSPKVIEQRAKRYFKKRGYRYKGRAGKTLYYESGSAWSSSLRMGPSYWPVAASVKVSEEATSKYALSVSVKLTVNTDSQMRLPRESLYWETEFALLTDYLETGMNKEDDDLNHLATKNCLLNLLLVMGVIVGIPILTCMSFILLIWLDSILS
jgi:hypothetical protein